MRRAGFLALLGLVLASMSMAAPPKTSIRPLPRPIAAAPAVASVSGVTPVLRPQPRPLNLTLGAKPVEPAAAAQVSATNIPHPMPRPKGLHSDPGDVVALAATPAPTTKKPTKKDPVSRKGSVCGDPDIRGEALPPITSKTKGCGVAEPVKVTAIDGIPFSQPATIDCETAKATKRWIEKGMIPAFGNRQVVQLHIFGSYMCRTRNNVRGAKISEHGRGKAIDFAGFIFSDGTEWTVARDYNKSIRKAQKAACGIFGTTLGPGSDGYHEDHLHFDTAGYRSGPYCR